MEPQEFLGRNPLEIRASRQRVTMGMAVRDLRRNPLEIRASRQRAKFGPWGQFVSRNPLEIRASRQSHVHGLHARRAES